ncbi:YdcF family protein [Pseudofrankia sp. DC12]|uniref:YdcF family protein n=1 Tax=Pseudofrankia sp. DC12 TaxID=683315 RepID=UPI0005F7EBA4|nr:YdcF family protein [Pseudofrankia sp. DC12]
MSSGPTAALPGVPDAPAGLERVGAGTPTGAANPGPAPSTPRGLRRRRLLRGAAGLLIVGFLLTTAKLYVFPKRDAPVPVDAIVMFAGSTGRLELAVTLARDGYAPVLAVSQPTPADPCPPDTIAGVEVICFHPKPLTTQGEARWTGATARARGWRSILVITSTPQDTRARLRLSRCYDGHVRVMSVDAPNRPTWAYMVAYEWAATVKALTLQRSC